MDHALNPVILANKRKMLNILFKAASDTLLVFGRNPDNGLGGQLGIIAMLHTWDQKLRDHFHLHCLVPAGALCHDKTRWKPCSGDFLFHVKALSIVFREKYLDYVKAAYKKNELIFPGQTQALGSAKGFKDLLNRCYANRWVVDIREPIDKPEYVLDYLGRYTHRVAISNNRILSCDNGKVCFTYKNRDTGQTEQETIDAVEFIRRFLLHVLPSALCVSATTGFCPTETKNAMSGHAENCSGKATSCPNRSMNRSSKSCSG